MHTGALIAQQKKEGWHAGRRGTVNGNYKANYKANNGKQAAAVPGLLRRVCVCLHADFELWWWWCWYGGQLSCAVVYVATASWGDPAHMFATAKCAVVRLRFEFLGQASGSEFRVLGSEIRVVGVVGEAVEVGCVVEVVLVGDVHDEVAQHEVTPELKP